MIIMFSGKIRLLLSFPLLPSASRLLETSTYEIKTWKNSLNITCKVVVLVLETLVGGQEVTSCNPYYVNEYAMKLVVKGRSMGVR